MLRSLLLSSVLASALLVGGCASVADDGAYPSLERRAVEVRLNGPADSPPLSPPPPPATADVAAAIAALEADTARGEAAFRVQLAAAQPLVMAARGSASGSEAWFAAQAAISGLDQTRGAVRLALAELDRLHIASELDGRAADASQFASAAARVSAMAAMQLEAFTGLSAMLAD